MITRVRMRLASITTFAGGKKRLRFEPVRDLSLLESQRFACAVPCGHAEFDIDNEAALRDFMLGTDYLVAFASVMPMEPEPPADPETP